MLRAGPYAVFSAPCTGLQTSKRVENSLTSHASLRMTGEAGENELENEGNPGDGLTLTSVGFALRRGFPGVPLAWLWGGG